MMAMMRYNLDLQKAYATLQYREADDAGLLLLCLWSAVGMTMTSLFFAMGFGPEIGQALMMAG